MLLFFLWLPQVANHWKRSTASLTTVSYSSKTDSVLCMVKSVVDRFVVKAPIELVKFRAEYYRHCITSLLKAVGVNIERSVISTRQLVQHDRGAPKCYCAGHCCFVSKTPGFSYADISHADWSLCSDRPTSK